jgi:hypothetical protein
MVLIAFHARDHFFMGADMYTSMDIPPQQQRWRWQNQRGKAI